MTQDLNTEIKIGADASGVETGVAGAKKALASLGQAADQVGRTGGEGLKKIGAGGEDSARRLDSATKNMVASLQRQIAAAEAGGTANRQYQESIARLRGADVNALKPYLDQLDAARDKAEKAARANAGLEGSMGSLSGAASLARSALTAMAGSITIGAFVGFVRGINDGIDALNDIKDATGSSIENISALEDVALRAGHSMDTVTSAMVKFNQVLSDAKPGSAQEQALKAIGLSAKELRDLDPAEALLKTAQALTQFEDDANKARLVQELFGKSIREVAPFLNDLAEKGALVAKVTSEQAEEAAKFAKQVSDLEKGLDDASRAMVSGMLPSLNQITQAMRDGAIEGGMLLGVYRGIAEFSAIAFGTDKLGKDISAARAATAEMQRLSNVMIGVQQVLDRDPGNEAAQRRLASLRAQLDEVSRRATAASEAIKGVVGVNTSATPAEPPKASVGVVPDVAAQEKALAESKRLSDARKKELQEQAKLIAELSGLTSSFAEDWARLTAVYQAGGLSLAQYTQAQADLLAKQPAIKAAADAEVKAREAINKANLEAAQTHERYIASLLSGTDKIRADATAQEEATRRMGLSKEAVAELDSAKLEMLATDLELQAIKQMDRNLDEQAYTALKAQAEAYRELASAKRAGASKEQWMDAQKASDDAAKKVTEEWKRSAEKIEDSLTDALMRGFESGKDFAENLRDTVSNMFRTLVLRPIISAAMSPVAGAINGMLYGNAAAAAGGGASALGMIGSGANLINGLQGTQGMLGTVGGWLGLNTVATNAGLAATIGIDAASAAAAANAAGAAGGGLLSGFGAALPWIGGIAALVSILGGLDDSGTYHTGGAAQYSGARGLMSGQDATGYGIGFGRVEAGAQTITAVSTLAQSLGTALDGIAVAFGQTAGYEIATAFADDTSEDGAWGGLRISRDGQELLNWENNRQSRWAPREFGDGEEGYRQYLAAVAQDTRQVLLDMDLPSWADDMLESIGDSASMEQLTGVLNQIGVVQSAFVALGRSMEMFSGLTDEMQSGLLDAAGSIEALTAGAGAFYQGFYSEQERIDAAVAQLNEALGGLDLSIDPRMGDDAKAQFRAAVEAAFAAGDAELAAALLALSGTFASTADYFAQISQQAADAAAQAAARQADTMGRLQIDLLRAQGNDLAAVALERERELAALAQFGPAAVAMQQQIYGLIDAMAASNAAANAYFADIDRAAAEQGYNDDAQAALDAMFGSISGGADAAAQSAASAAADAAKAAAASWRSAASSIQSSLDKLRASTTALSDPASRYAETKSVLDEYTRLALGGDASAAEKLAGAADAFLSASEGGTMTQAEYLRDRVLTEAKLASVMESSEAQASLQESIASSAGAAVSELQALNSNLTGFAGDLYDLLRNSYSDVGRDGATGIAATFAKMQADFDAYFNASTGWAAVGSKYSDPSFGGASFTKLDNNMAQFTGADGVVNYLRAGESLLDVAKRIPELRKLWEQTYNIRLPAFAEGGMHGGGLRLVGERGWEIEATGPARYWNQAQLSQALTAGPAGAGAEVVAELRRLSAQLSQLDARLAEIEMTNDQMAQQQDNGTDGGNAYRAEIMNVAALAKAIKEATV